MQGTSRLCALTVAGLLAVAGAAACSLAGSDVDHYNSGNKSKGDASADPNGDPDGGSSDGK